VGPEARLGMAAGGAKDEIDSGLQKENPTSTYQLMQVGIVETNDIKSYAAELLTKQGEFNTCPLALWTAYSSGCRSFQKLKLGCAPACQVAQASAGSRSTGGTSQQDGRGSRRPTQSRCS
jgi:hypothetical protein